MIWTLLGLGVAFLVLTALGGWVVLKMLGSWLDRQIQLADRQANIEERKVALEEKRVIGAPAPAGMPPDLMRRVTAWQDVDARDQERKILLDLYNELQDWDKVRAALPKAPDDQIPEHPELGLVRSVA
jgi:hypothetical protein